MTVRKKYIRFDFLRSSKAVTKKKTLGKTNKIKSKAIEIKLYK